MVHDRSIRRSSELWVMGYEWWWVMSDEWWVMSDEWWVMSDEWWVMSDELWVMSDEWWVMSYDWWLMTDDWWVVSGEWWVLIPTFCIKRFTTMILTCIIMSFCPIKSSYQSESLEQELLGVNIERDCLTSEMHKLANKPNKLQRDRLRKAEIEISLEQLGKRAVTLRSQIKRSPGLTKRPT